ncbi:MAG: PfkB family carbohydrate kinase [Sphaerochaeta sp.]|nr:PfkB family carbohydrate kinase [Sphaerochaeta sp.]
MVRLLSFGEVLWDVFPQHQTLGGAPLNVACHFSRLGGDAFLASSLGMDSLGEEARKQIALLAVDARFLLEDPQLPTGRADILLSEGIPSYEFNTPCAWDRICYEKEMMNELVKQQFDVFCFGTLAQRSLENRNTLDSILKTMHFSNIFFDVNLRKSFFTKETLQFGLTWCTILKMNNEEVPVLASLLGYDADFEQDAIMQKIGETYGIDLILVTEGKKGLHCYRGRAILFQAPRPVVVVDTVGAGDSISAGFLYAYLLDMLLSDCLQFAVDLADYVISHQGAIPEYEEWFAVSLLQRLKQ